MKKSILVNKLSLNKKNITNLSNLQLDAVKGGGFTDPDYFTCVYELCLTNTPTCGTACPTNAETCPTCPPTYLGDICVIDPFSEDNCSPY